jgi:Rad3-related DNA helicase
MRSFPGFEERIEQRAWPRRSLAFDENQSLVVEAGTGVGKALMSRQITPSGWDANGD